MYNNGNKKVTRNPSRERNLTLTPIQQLNATENQENPVTTYIFATHRRVTLLWNVQVNSLNRSVYDLCYYHLIELLVN